MTIRPTAYDEDTQVYIMLDEEGSHTFEVPLGDIPFVEHYLYGPQWRTLVVKCLYADCPNITYHATGGGAAPSEVQQLSSRLISKKGCPCGLILAGQPAELAHSHAKKHCDDMDGKGRWQLDPPELLPRTGEENPTFEILLEVNSHYIVGIGPFSPGDPPEGYVIETIPEEFYEEACKEGAKYNPLTKELSNDRTGFQHVLDGSNGSN